MISMPLFVTAAPTYRGIYLRDAGASQQSTEVGFHRILILSGENSVFLSIITIHDSCSDRLNLVSF